MGELSIDASDKISTYSEILRIVADAGGVLFLLVITFYTFNMLITLGCYHSYAKRRSQKLDEMKNTKENDPFNKD